VQITMADGDALAWRWVIDHPSGRDHEVPLVQGFCPRSDPSEKGLGSPRGGQATSSCHCLDWSGVKTVEGRGNLGQEHRQTDPEEMEVSKGRDAVQVGDGGMTRRLVHEDERCAENRSAVAGHADRRYRKSLSRDLTLDEGFLGGHGFVGHRPKDESVPGRRDTGQPEAADARPVAAAQGLRGCPQGDVLEPGLGPQQPDELLDSLGQNYHGFYRNGYFWYCRAMTVATDSSLWTIDELAAQAGVPVRTIREYQTMRVLAAPRRRGRVGFYDDSHLRRLRLIARLQDRGYSLAAMRDLFDAWTAGDDLAGIFDDPDGPALEEAPVVFDAEELALALPHVSSGYLAQLERMGVVVARESGDYCVPSPSILRLLEDAVSHGIGIDDAFKVLAAITTGVSEIADTVADVLATALAGSTTDKVTLRLLRRGRILVAQGTSRLLLSELGRSLSEQGRPELSALVDHLKTGAVARSDSLSAVHDI
jgi:DNA-binding transcriptional MerR regulator